MEIFKNFSSLHILLYFHKMQMQAIQGLALYQFAVCVCVCVSIFNLFSMFNL